MPVLTQKYVRQPLYVYAVEVTEENFVDIANWCGGTIVDKEGKPVENEIDSREHQIHLRVNNPINMRQTLAKVSDWILYTDKGYKIYTKKAFHAAFNPVDA